MFMQKTKNNLLIKLNHFIRKYYLNELSRGGIWFISILTSFFIFLSIIEYYYQFDINVRTTLFWIYIILYWFNVFYNIKMDEKYVLKLFLIEFIAYNRVL